MPYSARLRVPRQSLRIAVVQFAPKVRLMLASGWSFMPRADRPSSTEYRKGEKVL